MFIKPAPGLKIRDSITKLRIPETGIAIGSVDVGEGEEHPTDPYWARLLRDGDVVVAEDPTAKPAEVEKPSKAIKSDAPAT